MMKTKSTTKTIIKIASIFIAILILLITAYISLDTSVATAMQIGMPIYSEETIKSYNGGDLNLPVYIAYEGFVYDVTPGREDFYNEGKDYHYLAGRDSTIDLNIVGGSIIKKKYKIVGVYK